MGDSLLYFSSNSGRAQIRISLGHRARICSGFPVAAGVFGRIAADWEYWTLSDHEYHETTGDKIIVTGRYNAKHKITGKVIKAQFTHIWTLNNGKATRFQQYTDTKQVTDAMK